MGVDLDQCIPGDILIGRNGREFIYVGRDKSNYIYPHKIHPVDGVRCDSTRASRGAVFYDGDTCGNDIVEVRKISLSTVGREICLDL